MKLVAITNCLPFETSICDDDFFEANGETNVDSNLLEKANNEKHKVKEMVFSSRKMGRFIFQVILQHFQGSLG